MAKLEDQKALIIGGSRGLGFSISEKFKNKLVCSRKSEVFIDASKETFLARFNEIFESYQPDVIFYVPGGGPHGEFFSKPLQSHEWAYKVNAFSPIALAYDLIAKKYEGEFIYIGSAIAERSKSKLSLSYSQSKKMAKETLLSIPEQQLKARVFSPPYMDTDMLTKNAWPRIEASKLVLDTDEVSEALMNWLADPERASAMRHFDWLKEFEYDIPEGKEI